MTARAIARELDEKFDLGDHALRRDLQGELDADNEDRFKMFGRYLKTTKICIKKMSILPIT